MTPQQQLLTEIDAFLALHRMSVSKFGIDAVNDAKLIPRLRLGKNVTIRTLDRARQFMANFRTAAQPDAEQADPSKVAA